MPPCVSKSIMIKILIPFLLCGQAQAETIHIQNWAADLYKVPCSFWKINSDGTVTQTGTIIIDKTGLTLTNNTFGPKGLEAEFVTKMCGKA
jgi:hypothetical protein